MATDLYRFQPHGTAFLEVTATGPDGQYWHFGFNVDYDEHCRVIDEPALFYSKLDSASRYLSTKVGIYGTWTFEVKSVR